MRIKTILQYAWLPFLVAIFLIVMTLWPKVGVLLLLLGAFLALGYIGNKLADVLREEDDA